MDDEERQYRERDHEHEHYQAVRPQRVVADRVEDERIPMFLEWSRAVQGVPSQAS